ncbi:response regulator transcription factor [Glutamicibacter sp.]|uniref:response regulator transcription factor n=1 Tax=Glutamicibacter sp. TaxID=1931995 RepID=UPI0028BE1A1C|nr:response regulator transcription factor [Glutamicibacter sp.]
MTSSAKVSVLVVDDDALIRAGICSILGSDDRIAVVGEAENGYRAIELSQRLKPQVVLMDIRMPQLDGLAALEELRTIQPGSQVIILTTFGEEDYIDRALRSGAGGFLLKTSSPEEIINAVIAVSQGAVALSPRIARRVVDRLQSIDTSSARRATSMISSLTQRESEVLSLLGSGATNAEIAERLVLTQATVKGYVTAILLKLGARNRVEAALIAFQAGRLTNFHADRSPRQNS